MEEVTVRKEELLNALTENQAHHREEFEKAQDGWRSTVIEELDRRLADARAGRKVVTVFSYPEPEDHTKDYDRVIRMVEMSVDSELTIAEHDFAQFVMDDWHWKANWSASNMAYVTRAS